MKSFLSLVVPALLSAPLFAAAPGAAVAASPGFDEVGRIASKNKARRIASFHPCTLRIGLCAGARLAAELRANGDDLEWDIWKDSRRWKPSTAASRRTRRFCCCGRERDCPRVGYASVEELSRWMERSDGVGGRHGRVL